jgi:uncharacterized hydrophobic protein (TIGR00271 family)
MRQVDAADLTRMRDSLFFEGPDAGRRTSRFWILLVFASIIASAGVVGDSTATVIGAMIVAPLMIPILGVVLGISLASRPNLFRSLAYVVAGAAVVIAIGFMMGLVVGGDVVAATNGQVAARVSPRLIDLVAALATGVVGSFALCRSDVSDTLPGVAIAISLVPPLAVVGLTLESGEPKEAWGALLLFVTNVTAILATGVVVMALHGVHRFGDLVDTSAAPGVSRRGAAAVIVVLVVAVIVPLSATSFVIARDRRATDRVRSLAEPWAAAAQWDVVNVDVRADVIVVRAVGPEPPPDPAALRAALDDHGLGGVDLKLELVPELRADLPGK